MIRVTNDTELRRATALHGSEEVVLAPGRYRPVVVRGQTLRAEERWQSVFVPDDTDTHNIYALPGSRILGVASHRSAWDGIKVEEDCEVRDCWVKHADGQGIASHNEPDQGNVVIEGNLVEFCGKHIQFDHGIYASGTRLTIARNIVRHCSGWGLHLYPHLSDSLVHHNVVTHQSSGKAAVVYSRGGNVIANNTLVDRVYCLHVVEQILDTDTVANNLFCGDVRNQVDQSNWVGSVDAALFVESKKGVYWLGKDSPCSDGGKTLEQISENFWGQQITQLYRGAFAHRVTMERPEYRDTWYYGWPYQCGRRATPDPLASERAGIHPRLQE